METKNTNNTVELLDSMYKNVKMGSDSIINLMPKVKDESLRTEMTAELAKFEDYSSKIGNMLHEEGVKPKEENPVTKIASKVGVTMNTMIDSTPSHIAQMMMEGYTMGIADMTKDIRQYENTMASERSLKLARDIVSFEEDCFEKIKRL